MAVAVVKKENESNEKLVSRFEKKVQQARLVQWLKRNRFFKRNTSKTKTKDAGLSASRYRAERERLKYYN
jgi:ribosomal protein S21